VTKLSVNINKFATLRNARGVNNPDILKVARDCEAFGADGITVHPRPDERHIRYQDVLDLREVVKTEFNIEGNPTQVFLDLVLRVKPEQCTLVPDDPGAVTSSAGWDTVSNQSFLSEICAELKNNGIRSSIFLDPNIDFIDAAAHCGCDRIELYTEPYAAAFTGSAQEAVEPFALAAEVAARLHLGINAGHDLDLHNLQFFHQHVKGLEEVSIGHALVCDALYFGLENTIRMYKGRLKE